MKKFLLFLFLFLVGAFGVSIFAVMALTKSPLDDWQGSVNLNVIMDEVFVKQGNLAYQPVSESVLLNEGDMVKTGENGEAEILLGEGAVIRLAENTELQINEASLASLWEQTVNVSVNQGKIWFRIIKIFDAGSSWEVETPTVVATVRGTAFGVSVADDSVDFTVAESEVYVKDRKNKNNQQEFVASAGQIMKVNKNFEVLKEKLDLADQKNGDLKKWLNQNLEKDKNFRIKVQEKVNAEVLKNLKAEPGTVLYEAQLLAEKIRIKLADETDKVTLQKLQEKRRLAETLWLTEQGDDKKLRELLNRPELKNFDLPHFDKLPQLMVDPDENIKKLFDLQSVDSNIFDINSLENRINSVDFERIPSGFEQLDTAAWAEYEAFLQFMEQNPEFMEQINALQMQGSNLSPDDIEGILEYINSPEYLEMIKTLEQMDFSMDMDTTNQRIGAFALDPEEKPLALLVPANFKDYQVAMEYVMNHPEIERQTNLVADLVAKIDVNDEKAVEAFYHSDEYLELLDMMAKIPGYIGPLRSDYEIINTRNIELLEVNSLNLK